MTNCSCPAEQVAVAVGFRPFSRPARGRQTLRRAPPNPQAAVFIWPQHLEATPSENPDKKSIEAPDGCRNRRLDPADGVRGGIICRDGASLIIRPRGHHRLGRCHQRFRWLGIPGVRSCPGRGHLAGLRPGLGPEPHGGNRPTGRLHGVRLIRRRRTWLGEHRPWNGEQARGDKDHAELGGGPCDRRIHARRRHRPGDRPPARDLDDDLSGRPCLHSPPPHHRRRRGHPL